MTQRNYTNTATPVPLSAAISATATTLTVSSTTGFPAAPFLLALERGTANEEVCLCTAVSAATFSVTRAYDGTTGKTHAVGAMVEHTVAAIDYREAGSPPRMTTAERDALVGQDLWDGRTVYNTDVAAVQVYSGGAWGSLGGNVVRVIEASGTYPSRPTNATYVEWVGPTDPSAQAGLTVSNGDTWVQSS